jgi:hypothetical protein
VYGASRLRESLSGSLSVSSMRHVLGIGRLGSFGGDMGEGGQSLSFLGGGCVYVLRCVGCGWKFVGCVGVLVGDEGSCVVKVWLGGGVWLSVVWLFGFVWVCVVCVLLAIMSMGCVLLGGLRLLPAL